MCTCGRMCIRCGHDRWDELPQGIIAGSVRLDYNWGRVGRSHLAIHRQSGNLWLIRKKKGRLGKSKLVYHCGRPTFCGDYINEGIYVLVEVWSVVGGRFL